MEKIYFLESLVFNLLDKGIKPLFFLIKTFNLLFKKTETFNINAIKINKEIAQKTVMDIKKNSK